MPNPDLRSQIDSAIASVQVRIAELDQIQLGATEYSDSVAQLADSTRIFGEKFGGAYGRYAYTSAQSVGSAAAGLGVGLAIATGFSLISSAIDKVGGVIARRKREKALNEVMVRKQRLASEKIAALDAMLPALAGNKELFGNVLYREAETQLEPWDLEKKFAAQKEISQLFQMQFVSNYGLARATYLQHEFRAWLDGKHESGYRLPSADDIWGEAVRELLVRSKIPKNLDANTLESSLTEGAIYIMCDPGICQYLLRYSALDLEKGKSKAEFSPRYFEIPQKYVNDLNALEKAVAIAARKTFYSHLFRFGAARKFYLQYYRAVLSESPAVRGAYKSKRRRWIAAASILAFVVAPISIFSYPYAIANAKAAIIFAKKEPCGTLHFSKDEDKFLFPSYSQGIALFRQQCSERSNGR